MKQYSQDELLKIRDIHEEWLKTLPGYVGSGVGLSRAGSVCLKIFSDRIPAATQETILEKLEGIPTSIEETGKPRLQN